MDEEVELRNQGFTLISAHISWCHIALILHPEPQGKVFFFPGKDKGKEFLPNPLLSNSNIYSNYTSLSICCVSGTILGARDVVFNCM